jgi:hypothetical protein
MKKIALMFVLSIALLSCEKTLPDVPENEIPAWLKTRISRDELVITQSPKYLFAYGAWLRYKWQNEYYFEYHNPLWETTIAPVSESGDTLYYGATNMKYYNEKCCKQYVWKAPNYKEY